MIPKIYGYVAGGIIVLLILSALFGFVKYGEKVGKQEAEITRLEGELIKEKELTDELGEALRQSHLSAMEYLSQASKWETAYELEMLKAPSVVYRDVASTVPLVVPTGDCDAAALGSWMVLRDAQLLDAGVIP